MISFLSGKKTYALAALAGVATTLWYLGFLSVTDYAAALGILNSLGLASLRGAIAKVQ